MAYNNGLITWLKWWADGRNTLTLNMMRSGELADVASIKVMLDECLNQGLIEVVGVTLYDDTMPRYIHYELTAEGKRELGITQGNEREVDRASIVHAMIRGMLFNAGILVERYEQTKNGAQIRVDTADVPRLSKLPIEYHTLWSDLKISNIEVTAIKETTINNTPTGINTLETDILVYLHRVAKFNPYPHNTRSTDSIHEAVDRAVAYSLLETTLERMLVNGKIEKVDAAKDFWRYLDTPENAVVVANENTIIALNPTEERSLRSISEEPRDAIFEETYKDAVKWLLEYRFIVKSNHDGRLYILNAGKQWLAEHPADWVDEPTETDIDRFSQRILENGVILTDPNDPYYLVQEKLDSHTVVGYRVFRGKICIGGFGMDEISAKIATRLLNEETHNLRDETGRLQRYYDRSQNAVLAAHDYVKEHKLGSGGEDVVMLVIEDARELRQELIWMSIDREAEKNTNQHAERLLTDCKRERDSLRDELDKAQFDSGRWKQNYYATRENNIDSAGELQAEKEQSRELEIRNGQLITLLNRVKTELANSESHPDLHAAIEAVLSPDDDLPF